MSVASRFLELAGEWADHCRAVSNSSNPADYVNHPSVGQIVALGLPVVPLIMARFETDFSCPWEYALGPLTGVSMIDNPECVDGAEVHRRRLAWWATNRHRYPTSA